MRSESLVSTQRDRRRRRVNIHQNEGVNRSSNKSSSLYSYRTYLWAWRV